MSNIFTYAIDEHNLKVQLKGMNAQMSEQAWQKFDLYLQAHPFTPVQSGFKGFHINLNRNVVMPVAFGIIICLFSFLLFNFISIKNPQADLSTAEQPEIKLNPTVPVNNPMVQVMASNTEGIKTSPAEITEEKVESTPVVNDPAIAASEPVMENLQTEATKTVATVKRKRKTEEQQLLEIRPTVVSDDNDAEVEIIPN